MNHRARHFGRPIAMLVLLPALGASAQQALQSMLTTTGASNARAQQAQSSQAQNYTLKAGDFQMLVVPSMGLQWTDNVNLGETNRMADYIVSPAIGITASYPLSQRNVLSLDITAGYNWYLQHSSLSSFFVNSASGTGLSFDTAYKDITVDFHDRVGYSQGVGQNGSLAGNNNSFTGNNANGTVANTATYGTFQNTAGLLGTWDLNQAKFSLGYDHQNVLATTSQYDSENHSAELLSTQLSLLVHPKVTTGLEVTAGFTKYTGTELNDNDAYSAGPFIEFRPDEFFTMSIRGGWSLTDFENTSTIIKTSSQDSWYAATTISHQPTANLSYSLTAGREVQPGTVTDLLEDWYVRPTITWTLARGWTVTSNLFYEHGNQGVGSTGSLPGFNNETFDWYGGGASLQHAITKRFSFGLSYQLTLRASSGPNDSYHQNFIALQISYQPS